MQANPNIRPTGFARALLRLAAPALALALPALPLPARADTSITVVFARTHGGYTRTRLPDNSFKPETYGFANGGRWAGGIDNPTVDRLPFRTIAETIAAPLAQQGYVPARDPDLTDLMIFVFWGTTGGSRDNSTVNTLETTAGLAQSQFSSAVDAADGATQGLFGAPAPPLADDAGQFSMYAMENGIRDRTNVKNANILGYQEKFQWASSMPFPSMSHDVVDEIEHNRYFVILKAYDFQTARKTKQLKLRWEVRFSISEQDHDFSKELAAMVQQAARYFGQDSNGLVRRPLPQASVKLGDLKVIGVEPEK